MGIIHRIMDGRKREEERGEKLTGVLLTCEEKDELLREVGEFADIMFTYSEGQGTKFMGLLIMHDKERCECMSR